MDVGERGIGSKQEGEELGAVARGPGDWWGGWKCTLREMLPLLQLRGFWFKSEFLAVGSDLLLNIHFPVARNSWLEHWPVENGILVVFLPCETKTMGKHGYMKKT